MKEALIILICLVILSIVLNSVWHADRKQESERLYNHIDSVMQHRAHMDTMYWEHLEQCNFDQKKP
jgi:hypothetical protein